ncbi:MAG: biotin/lipoyl-binding protein [Anaerolineales bacterium]|nr:biotin/lipoyl-binding protein [Anaerolineales bacterium]MCB9144268.1 biotin/lipoyl-binding protein [Anaerolineales bacterium]
MKYKLNINNQTYQVEIEDINARPVVVYVDGQRFEVTPEDETPPQIMEEAGTSSTKKPAQATSNHPVVKSATDSNTLIAPLPGTVVEIFAKEGDTVAAGQVLLVIEAMKMKNSIRSVRSGKIAKMLVTQGQSVMHKQALAEFAA